ncbi:hypothetical protein CEXT_762141 [Caerostris extrusa]|uniref:Uncharacterized protein n=1 Tax=Caerostris extrusa TaxID=172846 RepID=A0AAV4NXS1_CAEEX|nr:hypothetical protein CEXT_762141 [Caerostris extrusa]
MNCSTDISLSRSVICEMLLLFSQYPLLEYTCRERIRNAEFSIFRSVCAESCKDVSPRRIAQRTDISHTTEQEKRDVATLFSISSSAGICMQSGLETWNFQFSGPFVPRAVMMSGAWMETSRDAREIN